MKFREYIGTHHAFTVEQIQDETGSSTSSLKTQLNRAVKSGQIKRIRRGSYVSETGRFQGQSVDAFEVVAALDKNAVLCFHSALEAHGVAHTVSARCQFRTSEVVTGFSFEAVTYEPFSCETETSTQAVRSNGGTHIFVTSREQTIVDCLNHPDKSGGIEEVLMSLSLFPYVDARQLVSLVEQGSSALAARVGWLLDQKSEAWRVPLEALDELQGLAGSSPARLDKKSTKALGWSKRWKLCFPQTKEEVEQWIL